MCQFSLVKGVSVKYAVAYYVDDEQLLNETFSTDVIPALNQTIYPNVRLGSQVLMPYNQTNRCQFEKLKYNYQTSQSFYLF